MIYYHKLRFGYLWVTNYIGVFRKMYSRGVVAEKLMSERDLTLPMYAEQHKLNVHSLRNTIKGFRPVWRVAAHIAKNDPEIFNLLPESSRRLVKGEYDGCNIPL